MFEKPEKLERHKEREAIEKMGGNLMSQELDRLPDSKRSGGFLLTTFLALGLAMAGAGKAEAQVRAGRFPIAGPTSGITGEIFQQGRIGASQVLDRHRMKAEIKINQEFQQKLQEIENQKNQLGQEFKNGKVSQQEYQMRMQKLDHEVYRLSHEKDRKVTNPLGIKGRVLQRIISGY